MLTNPNTLGLFEEDIEAIAAAVHEVGGLLYYDGANLNAILGVVRPGDMGFDIVHMNLHKTFAPRTAGGARGRSGRRLRAPGGVPPRAATRPARPPARFAGRRRRGHRAGAHLARQRPRALARALAYIAGTVGTGCGGWRSGRCSTPTGCATARRRLRRPLRPPLHARGGALGGHAEARYGTGPSTWASASWRRGFTRRRCTSRSSSTRRS